MRKNFSIFNSQFSIGFTLMEMLVVLVLVSLISTLLIQGLSHVLNLRLRFLSQLEKQTSEALQSHWFREISTGVAPGHPNGKNVFSGNTTRFRGLTLAPLKGMRGVPTPVSLELIPKDGYILLHYKEQNDDDAWEIGRWPGDSARFSYLDTDGRLTDRWPPPIQNANQLPEGIFLEVHDPRGLLIWFAAIRGRRDPSPTLRDLLEKL
jgi:general secretion pathway protein J